MASSRLLSFKGKIPIAGSKLTHGQTLQAWRLTGHHDPLAKHY